MKKSLREEGLLIYKVWNTNVCEAFNIIYLFFIWFRHPLSKSTCLYAYLVHVPGSIDVPKTKIKNHEPKVETVVCSFQININFVAELNCF